MHFNTFASVVLSGLAVVTAAPTERTDHPDYDQVQLVDLKYGGNGCPAGTLTKSFSSANDLVTILFDQYSVYSGPGVNPDKNRAACQLNLKMRFPGGWQFGVFKADYRGYVDIPAGAEGVTSATYYFSGDTNQVSRSVKFTGKTSGDYTKSDVIGVESAVWSPCGTEGMLNIKTSLALKPLGTSKPALMTVDSADLKYTQHYHVQWRRCKK